MFSTKAFLTEQSDSVVTITLNRPEKANALTWEVFLELRDVFERLRKERSMRAVVVTGAGRSFCSGADIDEIVAPLVSASAPALLEFARMVGTVVGSIRRLPKPVIAAVNGVAAGAGAALALACDFRIAAHDARFAFLTARMGLPAAGMGVAWLLPRTVGMARAMEILMTGDYISADQAFSFGLVNRVVESDRLVSEAGVLARRLACGPALGLALTKELLFRQASMDLDQATEAEAQALAIGMQHPDFHEAVQAFLERREPKFI